MVRVLFPHSRDYQESDFFFFFLNLVVLYIFLAGSRVKINRLTKRVGKGGWVGKKKSHSEIDHEMNYLDKPM